MGLPHSSGLIETIDKLFKYFSLYLSQTTEIPALSSEWVMFSLFSFLHVFSELYEHHYNTSTGKVLFTAAKTLCQMLEADVPMVLPNDMDLPAVIHDLACQAITVCHSGEEHV